MKATQVDVSQAYHLHKLFLEYLRSVGSKDQPKIGYWLYRFAEPGFFAILLSHGRQQLGIATGRVIPWDSTIADIEVFFVKKNARKIRPMRSICIAIRDLLRENGVKGLRFTSAKRRGKVLGHLTERKLRWTHSHSSGADSAP